MSKLTGSEKPILTTYAPAFDPSDASGVLSQTPWALKFHRFTPEGVIFFLPEPINDWQDRDARLCPLASSPRISPLLMALFAARYPTIRIIISTARKSA